MKICSFDVGIKNLAYCVMENDNGVKIIDWGIINNNKEDKIICEGILKNGKKCCKKASFYYKIYEDVNNDKYLKKFYCGTHKNNVPEVKKIEDINECVCDYLFTRKDTICNKKAYTNINGINYCNAHKKTIENKLTKLYNIKKKKKKYDMKEICSCMYNNLRSIEEINTSDIILIENQPGGKNITMKSVGAMLFGYFVFLDDNKDVSYANACNKLKKICSKNNINEEDLIISEREEYLKNKESLTTKEKQEYDKLGYNRRKQMSIVITEKLIEDYDDNIKDVFESSKKKDDLADAFLQGYYYLIKNE